MGVRTFCDLSLKDRDDPKAWWPPRVVPPKGAPNVLVIMTDDQGFGAPSTFGGQRLNGPQGLRSNSLSFLAAVPNWPSR
jgi:hypothetical protein